MKICLLLKILDKYVASTCCLSLKKFTDSLVCSSTSNRECMFSSCSFCKNFCTDKMEENIMDDNVNIAWSQWTNEHDRGEKSFQEMLMNQFCYWSQKLNIFCFISYNFFLILRLYSNKAWQTVPDYICNSLDGNLIRKKNWLIFWIKYACSPVFTRLTICETLKMSEIDRRIARRYM